MIRCDIIRLAAALGGTASDVFSLRLINGSPHASKRSKTPLPLIYEWEIRQQCAEGGLNHPQSPVHAPRHRTTQHTTTVRRSQASASCGLFAAHDTTHHPTVHHSCYLAAPLLRSCSSGANTTRIEGCQLIQAPTSTHRNVSGVWVHGMGSGMDGSRAFLYPKWV